MQFFDGYIERFTPHARKLGQTAQGYAERIISRLEAIQTAVESAEFLEVRQAFPMAVPAGGTVGLGTIRSGEEWSLDSVASTAGADVSIFLDGVLRWTKTFAGRDTAAGSGVILTGPGEVTVSASAAVTVVTQIARKSLKPARSTKSTGFTEPVSEMFGHGVEEHRHTAPGVTMKQTEPGVLTR